MGILEGIGLIIRVMIGLVFVFGGAFLIYSHVGVVGSVVCGIITFPWLAIFGVESLEAFFAIDSSALLGIVCGGIVIPVILSLLDFGSIANALGGIATIVYGIMFSGLFEQEIMTKLINIVTKLGFLAFAPVALLIIFVILFIGRFG